jgi:hypothetical protein
MRTARVDARDPHPATKRHEGRPEIRGMSLNRVRGRENTTRHEPVVRRARRIQGDADEDCLE